MARKNEQGMEIKPKTVSYYNCSKCPAYCCSIYERVQVTKRDVQRLARYFGVDYETAQQRYTTTWQGERILRRKADPIFGKACKFPDRTRCAYYDLLTFERSQQGDDTVLPLVQITFRNGDK